MSTEARPSGAAAANRVYQDIDLASSAEWVQDEGHDTLIVNLQGYKKENLRIQVTSTRNIRVLGERPVGPENNVWQRFRKEFPVPSNCDVNETSARFDNGFLYVKIPKTIAPVEAAAAATKDHEKLQKPATTRTEALPKPPKPTTTNVPPPAAAAASTQQKVNSNAPPKSTNSAAQEQIAPSKAIKENKGDGSSKAKAEHANNNGAAQPAELKAAQAEKEKTEQASKVTNGTLDKKNTSMEKEKDHTLDEKSLAAVRTRTREDVVNSGKRVDDEECSTKEDARSKGYCSMRGRTQQGPAGYYRQVVDGLVMELKEPRKLVNLAVAFGCVLVLGLYVKYAVNSIEEFENHEF